MADGFYVYTSNSAPKSARIVHMSVTPPVNQDFASVPPGDIPSHGRWLMARDRPYSLIAYSAYFFVVDSAGVTHIKKLSGRNPIADVYSTKSVVRGEVTDGANIYTIENEPGKPDTVVIYLPNESSSLDRSIALSNPNGHTITDLVINKSSAGGISALETYTIHDPHWNTDEEHFVVENASGAEQITSKDVVISHGTPTGLRFSNGTTAYGFSVGDGLWSMPLDTLAVRHLPTLSFSGFDIHDQNLANRVNLAFGSELDINFALMGLEYLVVGSDGQPRTSHTFAAARLDGSDPATYDVDLPSDCQLTPTSDDHRLADQLVTDGIDIYLACGARISQALWINPSN